ncbi:hypothetical protein WDZ17_13655 [Pseudokineococcus basanitobsidens]|uniref:DUF5666 domain-containing protein n=1 Tax=Pseudokineococcus basanitobsidens TaxID=1926649 RepID=A0ABU8RN17_9ACTN
MRPRARTAVPALLAVLVLAGCGQEGEPAGSSPATTAGAASPSSSTPAPTTPGDGMATSDPGGTGPGTSGSSPGSSAGPTVSAPTTGGSIPLMPRPTAPPTTPTDVPQPVVLVGEVVEPSSPDCVEMTSGGQVFSLLLPAGTSVAVGDRVRVTGTPRPVERGTPCAGTRVRVSEVAPAG